VNKSKKKRIFNVKSEIFFMNDQWSSVKKIYFSQRTFYLVVKIIFKVTNILMTVIRDNRKLYKTMTFDTSNNLFMNKNRFYLKLK
jgi:hypothetical protein